MPLPVCVVDSFSELKNESVVAGGACEWVCHPSLVYF